MRFRVGDLVVCRANERIGEIAGTMKIENQLLYIINFYDQVDPRASATTHPENELGRVIR